MVDERQQKEIPDLQRRAWLAEYQACQQDNSSSGTSYWTMAAIFIGISSVLILGLGYGVITNAELQKMWLEQLQGKPSEIQAIQALQTISTVVGILIVLMLSFVRLWLRRIRLLQQINFHRMREIESQLGMWKSWRVHGVDHWNSKGDNFDNEISDEDKGRLLGYQPKKFWRRWSTRPRYARPSGWYYDGIFYVLIFLCLFLAFIVWSPLIFPSSLWGLLSLLASILIIGATTYYVIRFTQTH